MKVVDVLLVVLEVVDGGSRWRWWMKVVDVVLAHTTV